MFLGTLFTNVGCSLQFDIGNLNIKNIYPLKSIENSVIAVMQKNPTFLVYTVTINKMLP